MIANIDEKDAIVQYLGDSGHERTVRRRLFERASDEPEKVLIYLDSLPEGVETEDEITQRLRHIATAASQGYLQIL